MWAPIERKRLFWNISSFFRRIWKNQTSRTLVKYILSGVCLRLNQLAQLSFMQYIGLCVFGLPTAVCKFSKYNPPHKTNLIASKELNYIALFWTRQVKTVRAFKPWKCVWGVMKCFVDITGSNLEYYMMTKIDTFQILGSIFDGLYK